MAKLYLNNQHVRRSFVLYEFQKKEPIFESFKNLCETMGYRFMTYREFEFWFQRFSGGNFDLDYDWNQDSKTRTLTDLPNDLIEKVFEKLGNDNRIPLRRVCRKFRALVDARAPLKYDRIEIYINRDHIALTLDNKEHFEYSISSGTSTPVDRPYLLTNYAKAGNRVVVAIEDLMSILKHPTLEVEHFEYRQAQIKDFVKILEPFLKKSGVRIKARHVRVSCCHLREEIRILNYFQPGARVELDNTGPWFLQKELGQFASMLNEFPASANAEHLLIESGLMKLDKTFIVPRLLACPRVTLCYETLEIWQIAEIMKYILKSSHAQEYGIKLAPTQNWTVDTFKRKLIDFGAEPVPADRPNHLIYRNPRRDNREHFEIEFSGFDWKIERKEN